MRTPPAGAALPNALGLSVRRRWLVAAGVAVVTTLGPPSAPAWADQPGPPPPPNPLSGLVQPLLTPGCTRAGLTVTCIYTEPGQQVSFLVPDGVSVVQVTARGAAGGAGGDTTTDGAIGGVGGRGAVARSSLTLAPGAGLTARVGARGQGGADASGISRGVGGAAGEGYGRGGRGGDGTDGNDAVGAGAGGGGGGGGSAVVDLSGTPLVVAGAGAGGGGASQIAGGRGDVSGTGGSSGPDGSGGDTASNEGVGGGGGGGGGAFGGDGAGTGGFPGQSGDGARGGTSFGDRVEAGANEGDDGSIVIVYQEPDPAADPCAGHDKPHQETHSKGSGDEGHWKRPESSRYGNESSCRH